MTNDEYADEQAPADAGQDGAAPEPDAVAEAESADSRPEAEPEWKRRKRLAELFGESLPEVSRDERAREGGDRTGTPDDWFRSQVPPHHG